MEDVLHIPEAFAYCESIQEPAKNRLVWDGLLASYHRINQLSSDDTPGIVLDAMVLAKLLEAITADLETLVTLANGTTLDQKEISHSLREQVEARSLITRSRQAFEHANQIATPEIRSLVQHGLAISLQWLLENLDTNQAQTPVDLLLHTHILEEVFRSPHGIAHTASGKPPLPWIVEDNE